MNKQIFQLQTDLQEQKNTYSSTPAIRAKPKWAGWRDLKGD